jgi:hypothetical protein
VASTASRRNHHRWKENLKAVARDNLVDRLERIVVYDNGGGDGGDSHGDSSAGIQALVFFLMKASPTATEQVGTFLDARDDNNDEVPTSPTSSSSDPDITNFDDDDRSIDAFLLKNLRGAGGGCFGDEFRSFAVGLYQLKCTPDLSGLYPGSSNFLVYKFAFHVPTCAATSRAAPSRRTARTRRPARGRSGPRSEARRGHAPSSRCCRPRWGLYKLNPFDDP